MRDIRHDLRERLAQITARYADQMAYYDEETFKLQKHHQETISSLVRERAAVQQLLDIENSRNGDSVDRTTHEVRMPLSDFIVTKVLAHGPLTKEEIKNEASLAGYLEETSGRTFHLTLMNVTRSGRLRQVSGGRYEHPSPSNLFVRSSEESPMSVM